MQKITPFLCFNGNAEEAVNLYVGIFENSAIRNVMRYGDAGPGPAGSVMAVTFQLEGQDFIAMNGGPSETFSPAMSLFVDCQTQEKVDHLWAKLSEGGGHPVQCGWIRDRFGVTWQIVPSVLSRLLHDQDPEKTKRVMQVMMKMVKLDVKQLEDAYAGN